MYQKYFIEAISMTLVVCQEIICYETVVRRCSEEIFFCKISQNYSHESTCRGALGILAGFEAISKFTSNMLLFIINKRNM